MMSFCVAKLLFKVHGKIGRNWPGHILSPYVKNGPKQSSQFHFCHNDSSQPCPDNDEILRDLEAGFVGNGVSFSKSFNPKSRQKILSMSSSASVQKQRPRKSDSGIKGKDGQKPGRKRSVMVSGKVPKFKHLQIGKVKPKTAQMYEAAVQKLKNEKGRFRKDHKSVDISVSLYIQHLCESRCITDASYAVYGWILLRSSEHLEPRCELPFSNKP